MTRPTVRRLVAGLTRRSHPGAGPPASGAEIRRHDSWLQEYCADELAAIDRRCGDVPIEDAYALFRELDDDVWALLLTQQYTVYPNIKSVLPDVPAAESQELWNGLSGAALATQSTAFYQKVRRAQEAAGTTPLDQATVLDFGCGWGRMMRLLARDVAPRRLYGCDPLEGILDVCRQTRVPGTRALSDFMPAELPFEVEFDLAYAFSVFTHLSERAARQCLRTLHGSLKPGGLLVLTVRPPAFVDICEPLRDVEQGSLRAAAGRSEREAEYLFAAHRGRGDASLMWGDSDRDYGDAIMSVGYVRRRWASDFELIGAGYLLCDPYQTVLTLRRR